MAENNKLNIGGKEIKFSVNAIKWFGIILDSGLKLKAYIDQKMEKTRNTIARI